jgi:hypothetical protein
MKLSVSLERTTYNVERPDYDGSGRCLLFAEMRAHALADLLYRGFDAGDLSDCVEKDKIVDHSVIAHGRHVDAGLLELAGIGLTLVTKRVVLRCDDERRREAFQLFAVGPEGRDLRVIARPFIGRIEIPTVFHECASQEAAGGKLMIG